MTKPRKPGRPRTDDPRTMRVKMNGAEWARCVSEAKKAGQSPALGSLGVGSGGSVEGGTVENTGPRRGHPHDVTTRKISAHVRASISV